MTFSRYGAKVSMITGFVGVSLSAVLAFTATHFTQLILSVFVFGFFEAHRPTPPPHLTTAGLLLRGQDVVLPLGSASDAAGTCDCIARRA